MSDFKLPSLDDLQHDENTKKELSPTDGLGSLPSLEDINEDNYDSSSDEIITNEEPIVEIDWDEDFEDVIEDENDNKEVIDDEELASYSHNEDFEEYTQSSDEEYGADKKVEEFFNNLKSKVFKGSKSPKIRPKEKNTKFGVKKIVKIVIPVIVLSIALYIGYSLLFSSNTVNKFKATDVTADDTVISVISLTKDDNITLSVKNIHDISADITIEAQLKRSFLPTFDNSLVICTSDITVLEVDEEKEVQLKCNSELEDKNYSIEFNVIKTP